MYVREQSRRVVGILRHEELIDFRAVFTRLQLDADEAFGKFDRIFVLTPLEWTAVRRADVPCFMQQRIVLFVGEDMEEEGLDKRHSPKQGNVCYVDLYKVSMRETSYPWFLTPDFSTNC